MPPAMGTRHTGTVQLHGNFTAESGLYFFCCPSLLAVSTTLTEVQLVVNTIVGGRDLTV